MEIDEIKKKKLKYIKVYEKLYDMIQDGTFAPGTKLPSENDLAEQMQISRMTLRKALVLLQEDNLIQNKNGVGNFVMTGEAGFVKPVKEPLSHPIYKSCTETLDRVELEMRIEAPTQPILDLMHRKTPAIVIADRWYKHGDLPLCYSLSIIPIEVIGQENLDLTQLESLKQFLEKDIYQKCRAVKRIYTHSTAGNFTAAQYTLSNHASFTLIREWILDENNEVLLTSKHYIPIDYFQLSTYNERG